MAITLRQMQVFLAVAQTENLSAAALTLGMSKSAVSQALSDLEEKLGVTLFERMRGRLLLSAEGRHLKPAADELMERSGDIETLFSSKKKCGQLRLSVTLTIGSFLLADLLRDFHSRTGWIPEVTIANTTEVAESLSNFTTDVSIIEGPVYNPDLITEHWMDDEMVVVAPRSHRFVGRQVSWEELAKERWILREQGSSTRVYFDTRLADELPHHNIIASVNSFETIVGMVVNGMGLSFMSERVLHDPFNGPFLRKIECSKRFMRQLSFCWHRQKYISSDMSTWFDFCRFWAADRLEKERLRREEEARQLKKQF